jgi:4-amino-4-deoxy-L-arabinose transferase-like glycosyltransferase
MTDPSWSTRPSGQLRWSSEAGDRVALAFLGLGIAVRLRDWLYGRCLWVDEAMLALNLMQRDFAGLLAPLDRHQMAPPGYLWAVKALMTVIGSGERSLRLVALLAGVATMITVWLLTRRVFGSWAAAAGSALIALSSGAIYYSNEVKPYSCDALVAATLILAGIRLIDASWGRRIAVALAVAGSLALWCSFTAPFTLAGLGLALGIVLWRRAAWREFGELGLVILTWVATWAMVRHLATQGPAYSSMQEYWRGQFLDVSVNSPNQLAVALRTVFRAVTKPFASPSEQWDSAQRLTVLTLAMTLIGAVALARRREWAVLSLFVAGPAVGLLAAAFHQYPVEARLWQFVLPAIVGLAGGGLVQLDSPRPLKPALMVAAIILVWPLIGATQTLWSPAEREDVVTSLHTLTLESKPGDTIYVWRGNRAQLEYYRSTRPALWPSDVKIVSGVRASSPRQYLADLGALCHEPRVWLVATHLMEGDAYREVINSLSARGAVLSVWRSTGNELSLLTFPCALPAGPEG